MEATYANQEGLKPHGVLGHHAQLRMTTPVVATDRYSFTIRSFDICYFSPLEKMSPAVT